MSGHVVGWSGMMKICLLVILGVRDHSFKDISWLNSMGRE